ncbi:hypothetical protein IRP63_08165 [Clostridium botulinum]|uniref:Peptidase S1 domain-containing protein n=1 Tax=Clostridium botulinum C/D str. DC5 TaxID=1443128 RepID=A0A0A0ICV9_CLOBO|nr:hypothetical protein [Clostridium botulinum]KEI03800.1 hypothetical protein Z952_07740 [Clostridium botulinum C/D str. BKT75002]KEI09008.1 hypothetical protein Z954_13760 [Clostridium botulinum C/D str. BKT2873]KGM93105.1 hypothetical protein Z956_12285 [Clostridium botulinum D str. CCUG 7971]KGM99274.1 hypothetical protein Z955_08255 [Clostridium botulinum C/D str. DC5]KOC50537.1 hypothetical protein ADU88_02410 [Clostridium botulinum]
MKCKCFNLFDQYKKRQKIKFICRYQYQYFLSKANVVGVGLGYKYIDNMCTYEECIKVFVTEKIPENEIQPKDVVPVLYQGIKTDVVIGGIPTECKLVSKIRPTRCGYIIGISDGSTKSITSGTLGCLVKNKEDTFVLSANHVLTNENLAPLGTPIIQPSIQYRGVVTTDTIAYLSKYIPLKYMSATEVPENYVDCALGKVLARSLVAPEIAILHKAPLGVSTAKLNKKVVKVGAMSERTTGIVQSINTTMYVKYSRGSLLFKDQIVTTQMSMKGDSGSLLLDSKGNAVGLLNADSTCTTNYSDISNVLRMLSVSLITK